MERYLVEQCSPTLASLKTGNLFSYYYENCTELESTVSYWNDCMLSKGVSVCVLRVRDQSALVYVYRKDYLERDLRRPGVSCFLRCQGYESIEADAVIERLKERLAREKEFPHEIGLFLGYPLDDVVGFIENCGRNCIFCGCWKVYGNAGEAVHLFQKYKKCTAVYKRLWMNGKRSVIQLTVAACCRV